MIAFSPQMFPNTVLIRKCSYPLGVQGGANPLPGTGTSYAASVQEKTTRSRAVEMTAGQFAATPRSCTDYWVYVSCDSADTFIPTLGYGDQIEWNGLVLTVVAPARNRGGYDVLWRIDCELIR